MNLAIAKSTPKRSSDAGGLLDAATSAIELRVVTSFAWMREQLGAATLAPLVANGDVDAALATVADTAGRAAEAIATDANVAYIGAGAEAAGVIGTATSTPGTFSPTSSPAVARMQAADLTLVQGLTAEQVETVRAALVDGLRSGENPLAVARRIEGAIGLTPTQAGWVDNYRRSLEQGSASALDRELRDKRSDRSVRRAASADGKPLTAKQIDTLVDRYRANVLRYRAQTIARTEALRAVHQGQEDAIAAAIAAGDLTADQVAFTWLATKDKRTRPSHWEMHGQVRAYGEPFLSGDGNLLRYPGDPEAPASDVICCRCSRVFSF